jgi:hypothetical protein
MQSSEPKTVSFPVLNGDTGEIEMLEMDEQDYKDMCAAEEEDERKRKEREQHAYEEERSVWRYIRDDD